MLASRSCLPRLFGTWLLIVMDSSDTRVLSDFEQGVIFGARLSGATAAEAARIAEEATRGGPGCKVRSAAIALFSSVCRKGAIPWLPLAYRRGVLKGTSLTCCMVSLAPFACSLGMDERICNVVGYSESSQASRNQTPEFALIRCTHCGPSAPSALAARPTFLTQACSGRR